jgi:maltose-binding protein MalE
MKIAGKRTVIAAAALGLLALLPGCGKPAARAAGGAEAADAGKPGGYASPAKEVSGELTIMMWSGDGSFMQDIGHKNYAPEDLRGQNQAAAYAVAKEFNALYPNVKINIYARSGGPDADGLSWAQHRENFAIEYGFYPDLYAATDIAGDLQKGMVADISIFSNDPVYQSFNPSIMAMMNFEGRQFGLPQYMVPWGIFVNRSLADANNIDVPDPNWTIDDYTAFVSHSQSGVYYGAMDAPMEIQRTGTKDFVYSLLNRKNGETYVDLNSPATRKLLEYIPIWVRHAVWPQNDLGNVSAEFMQANDSWSFNFFKNGKLLTLAGDPWMMGDAANPTPGHWGAVQFDNWDIYPRPSNEFVENHVGVVLDPFVIRNYAMDDGNVELSPEEYAKLHIAYEFAKFWCGDSRSWQARADQLFNDQGSLKTAMNDSFPLVTGDAFDEQMKIWYTAPIHQRFADKNKMPGFQYVLELWEKGQFWDISDKAYPWRYEFEGSVRPIVYEWENMWNPEVTGAARTDANWLDQVYAKLPGWNAQFNQRWADVFKAVEAGLAAYYKQ